MFMIVSLAVSGVCLLLLVVAFAWWRRKQHGYRRMRKRVQEMTVAVQDGGGWLFLLVPFTLSCFLFFFSLILFS
jgi:hypothetical protein